MTVQISQTRLTPPLQVSASDEIALRAWYTNSFIAGDGVTGVQGGNGQSGFYYAITCSLDDDSSVIIPAFDVQETTLSNPTAGFFGQLFVNGSPSQMVFGYPEATAGWQIPTVYGAVVSLDELARYNAAVQILYAPDTFPTYNQMIEEIRRLAAGVQTYAGAGILGLTQLSTAPADPAVPIALGANDDTVGNVRADLTPSTVPRAATENELSDGLATDDGTDFGIQTLGYFQAGDFAIAANGTRIEVNDTFGLAKLLAGGDNGNQYAGVVASAGVDATVEVQATGYSYLKNTSAGVVALGDGAGDNNGTKVTIDDIQQLITLSNVPTSDPTVVGAIWNNGGALQISAG